MKKALTKIALPIACIFSCRILGLFMLIPVFTLYAQPLEGATPSLMGIALGCYGLTQGLLQLPFGILSDRYGRKPLIAIGLILFGLGSLWGAYTETIWGMIVARSIQGAGAIGSVLMALLADLTSDKERTLSMAVIGGSIGLSFGVSFILSPIITEYFGLAGIFYVMIGLSLIGLFILSRIQTPSKQNLPFMVTSHFKAILKNPLLRTFNIGIFCQHAILTALFYLLPSILRQAIQAGHLNAIWKFYLPIVSFSFILMIPMIYFFEKKHAATLLKGAIGLIVITQLGLILGYESWSIFVVLLFIYFLAFNLLEAMLPSHLSQHILPQNKGTAMGVYSSFQFLGIFFGGSLAGLVYPKFGAVGILSLNLILALTWILTSKFPAKNLSDK